MKRVVFLLLGLVAIALGADAVFGTGILESIFHNGAQDSLFATIGGTALAVDRNAAIKQALLNKFQNMDEQQMSVGAYLRRYANTSNSAAQYEFNFNEKSSSNPQTTEQLLANNDLFLVGSLRYGLFVQTDANPGGINPQFYPNNQEFVTLAGATLIDMGIFWNGKLSLKSGLQEMEPMNTADFRYQPETEQSSATTFCSYPQHAGFVQVSPYFLSGNFDQKYLLKVDNTGADDVTGDAGYTIKIFLEPHGIRLFNMADFVKDSQKLSHDRFTLDCVNPFDAKMVRRG